MLFLSLRVVNSTESMQLEINALTVDAKKKFSTNESLKFSIHTGNINGFIYLIYINKTGDTNIIYPTDTSIPKKQSGTLNFPEDFDNIEIKTTKECKDCKEEKTTIFVLLSNDPIENIENMNESDFKTIKNKTSEKTRSLFNEEEKTILINQFDFLVE